MVGRLAVVVLPGAAVVGRGAFPAVVLGPGGRVVEIILIPGEEVGFHVAGMIGCDVPEGSGLGRVLRLPAAVDFFNYFPNSCGLGAAGGGDGLRESQDEDCCKDRIYTFHGLILIFSVNSGLPARG